MSVLWGSFYYLCREIQVCVYPLDILGPNYCGNWIEKIAENIEGCDRIAQLGSGLLIFWKHPCELNFESQVMIYRRN